MISALSPALATTPPGERKIPVPIIELIVRRTIE